MRAVIVGVRATHEVICEPFSIDGTDEKFVVHRHLSNDRDAELYCATHLATSFSFGYGSSIDGAIEHGRARWATKTPDEHRMAIENARKQTAERVEQRRFLGLFDSAPSSKEIQ